MELISGDLINRITQRPMLIFVSDHLIKFGSVPVTQTRLSCERSTARFIPADEFLNYYSRIRDFNLQIRQLIDQHKRTKLMKHLKLCNMSSGVSKLWTNIKSLRSHDDNRVEIKFIGRVFSDPKQCAGYFSHNLYCTLRWTRRKDVLPDGYAKCQITAHHLLTPTRKFKEPTKQRHPNTLAQIE